MDPDDMLAEHAKLEVISSHVVQKALPNSSAADTAISSKKLHPVVMQQLLQPRCNSSVWVYFQRLDTALAKCRICQNNYRFGSSITNLRNHARIKHPDILKQGPVKFLEKLKVPKEDVAKLLSTTQEKLKVPIKVVGTSKRVPSSMWTYFTVHNKDLKLASCGFCKKIVKYKSTTANLKNHLMRKHRKVNLHNPGSRMPDPRMRNRSQPSFVWSHFKIKNFKRKLATCNFCQKTVCYYSTLTNLKRHLEYKHKDDLDLSVYVRPKQPACTASIEPDVSSEVVEAKATNKKYTSYLWSYFTIQNKQSKLASCNFCKNTFCYKSTSANLKRHLQIKHPYVDISSRIANRPTSNRVKNQHNPDEFEDLPNSSNIKVEPTSITEANVSIHEDDEMQQTIDSIYEKSDNILNDYLETASPKCTTPGMQGNTLNESFMDGASANNSIFLEEDEADIDRLRSDNFISTNPLNSTRDTKSILQLREERLRAETNYFNKKATFVERSTEFIEIQKRYVMLQSQKLKLEIAAMKEKSFQL